MIRLIISSLMCVFLSFSVNAIEEPTIEEKEFHFLLSNLLKVNQNKFTFTDQSGNTQPDSLKMFKELEKIYIRNIEPDLENKRFSSKRLKIVMYFAFYSHTNNSAAFQEYLATDLMPIYKENQSVFAQVLKDLPFLIPANCDRLSAYFIHENDKEGIKPSFVESFKKLLSQYLNKVKVNRCISHFDN